MKLIVGLGNPGKEYHLTRHNIGYQILDEYLKNETWSKNEYAEYINITINSEKIIFIKPTTYMNLSGNAVRYFINYYKISIDDILIIQDDLDLDIGTFKLKTNSSSGGHNGIQSIIDNLGTNAFLRLKIGIAKPQNGDTINYVLTKLSKTEQNQIFNNLKNFINIINDFINTDKVDDLMNKYNGKSHELAN